MAIIIYKLMQTYEKLTAGPISRKNNPNHPQYANK
jgi:hypothetical protein